MGERAPDHGAGDLRASLKLIVHILGALHDGEVEHMLGVFLTDQEVLVVHVAHDGSEWFGWSREIAQIEAMKDLAAKLGRRGERRLVAMRMFDLSEPRGGLGRLLATVLMSLAEPASCTAAALLCRDVGEDPGWVVARYEPGRVGFLEADPGSFLDELIRIDEFAHLPCEGEGAVKPTLFAASVGRDRT